MTASFANQEIWHVLVASDDMKRMNVDQLDDAFRLDIVDASTMVWKTGMQSWRRLGSLAGIDEEPETIARPLGPPAPPPPPRPRPAQRAVARPVNPFDVTVNPFDATVNPFSSTTPAGVFDAPKLLAPVYTPPLYAPDPYVLPKRRVTVPSDVDFRRAPGVRWGRWLFAFVLITGGVLGAYRQNLLREGARRIGVESRYLSGERQVTAFVSAKAPASLKNALGRLKLLPGPNAATTPVAVVAPLAAPVAPTPSPAQATAPTPRSAEGDVKTVSLDSLPVLGTEPAAAAAPAPVARIAPAAKATPRAERAAVAAKAPVEKPEPKAEKPEQPEPKPVAKKAPPPVADTPLKAAIWAAMQAESKKK